jgi:hypothetical protein
VILWVPKNASVQVNGYSHAAGHREAGSLPVLLRFAYLAVSRAFAALRLLPLCDHEKDTEILALRHQLGVLQRQLADQRPHLRPEDRALLAALLAPLTRATLRRLRLLVSPDTVLRWHRDLIKQGHARATMKRKPGRPRTIASIGPLVLRLADENPGWGYRRTHGGFTLLIFPSDAGARRPATH